jgi:RNA-directed DNA polymerase
MFEMVKKYSSDRTTLLYAKKFLQAKGIDEEGKEVARMQGTPQGGVVSPLLANLYLHEAFDSWMAKDYSHIKFERYADDIVIHCVSENQAIFIKDKVERRLKKYKLELHPEKTRIVYTGRSNYKDKLGHKLHRKFTFLGYDFKPRKNKDGSMVYSPGMGKGALKKDRSDNKERMAI